MRDDDAATPKGDGEDGAGRPPVSDGPSDAEQPTSARKPKPTRAERLEAKAARLRDAEEKRAADAVAGRVPDRRPFVIATAALGGLAVALAALLLVTFLAWQDAKDSNDSPDTSPSSSGTPTASGAALALTSPAVESAVAAAKSFAVDFGTYDYQHLDTEFQEVAQKMTPSFAKSYLATSGKLKPTFVQYKTQVTARIQGYGVTSATADEAVVIIFLDQTVHTSQSSTPRIDRNRLEVDLVKTGGEWLVSKLLAK